MSLGLYRQFESCKRVVGTEEGEGEQKQILEDRFVPHRQLKSTLQGFAGLFWDREDRKYRCIKGASTELIESGLSVDGWEISEDFYGERDLLKRLSRMPDCHSTICRYVTDWESDSQSYYAMEFCPNGSLLDFANQQLHRNPLLRPSPQEESVINHRPDQLLPNRRIYRRLRVVSRVMAQIVDGLSWLHSKSIAHLDLSLENILMANSSIFLPRIKLIDFGVAVQFAQSPRKDDSLQKVVWPYSQCVGKTQYMALEVAQNRHDLVEMRGHPVMYDAKAADIATLGSILYMLIIGQYPPKDIREWAYDGHLFAILSRGHYASSFTEEAFDLLNRLWTHEATRITMDDLVKHPFILRGKRAYNQSAKPVKSSPKKPRIPSSSMSDEVVTHPQSLADEKESEMPPTDLVSTENDPLDIEGHPHDFTHRDSALDLEGAMNDHSSRPSIQNANGIHQSTDHHTLSEYPEEGMQLID